MQYIDIANWVSSCEQCAQADRAKLRRNAPLQEVKVYGPFEQIHIDTLGPVCESTAGNEYVLAMIDQSTWWVELVALPRQMAEIIAQAVFQEWIC